MADLATASADAAQNAILVAGTTYYLSLHTADPGATGANEGTAGRQAITFAASSGGSQASNSAQSFTGVPGGQTYTNFGIWTASSGGTYKRGGLLGSSITPPAGSTVSVQSGGITFTAS
jgi:hypothetical protein